MNAVILAAGFGTRMSLSSHPVCPKPLLPLGQGCVLDHVVTSVWVPGITAIQVVHNNAIITAEVEGPNGQPRRQQADLPVEYRKWKKGLKWEPEVGRNRDAPYIRLRNNGVTDVRFRRGSVGDLAFVVSQMLVSKIDRGLLVATADNLFSHPRLDRLAGETSAVTVRPVEGLDSSVLHGAPDFVRVKNCLVDYIDRLDETGLVCCSPWFLAKKDIPFLLDYVEYHQRGEVIPDSIGQFFGALAEDAEVRIVKVKDGRYRDTGTVAGYEHAQSLYAAPVAPKRNTLKEALNGKR